MNKDSLDNKIRGSFMDTYATHDGIENLQLIVRNNDRDLAYGPLYILPVSACTRVPDFVDGLDIASSTIPKLPGLVKRKRTMSPTTGWQYTWVRWECEE